MDRDVFGRAADALPNSSITGGAVPGRPGVAGSNELLPANKEPDAEACQSEQGDQTADDSADHSYGAGERHERGLDKPDEEPDERLQQEEQERQGHNELQEAVEHRRPHSRLTWTRSAPQARK